MEIVENKEIEIFTTEMVFEQLYETAFPVVAKFISKMNGSFQDARDIFQDALVIYYERSNNPGTHIRTTPEAYILGIAKNLWIRKFNRNRKHISLDSFEASITIPEDFFPSLKSKLILQFLETTGKKCMDLLHGFYYDNLTIREIREVFGYRNEHSATVQKYKCLEKVRDTIKEKSRIYEDFID